MDQRELLAVVEDSWRQLDAALEGLDEAPMMEPGVVEQWSVKDLLGHVTTWEQVALRNVGQTRRGETPAGLGGIDVDDYNAAEAAARRDQSLEQVRQESTETRQRLRAAIASISDAEWDAVYGEGDRAAPLGVWVGRSLGGPDGPGTHAAEHAAHIRAWRAQRAR